MKNTTENTVNKWQADACPDANGFTTIRQADGTRNGNTDAEVIATVFNPENAALIVRAGNEYDALRECENQLKSIVDELSDGYGLSQNSGQRAQLAISNIAALRSGKEAQ